jgi:hypothetical protein
MHHSALAASRFAYARADCAGCPAAASPGLGGLLPPKSDHDVPIDGFWMDEASVIAGEFRRFVQETG